VHESRARRHVTEDTSDQGQKERSSQDQSINPLHQWTHLFELRDSYEPGPPTQEAIQLLLNRLKKFYLIVKTQTLTEIYLKCHRMILTRTFYEIPRDSIKFHINRYRTTLMIRTTLTTRLANKQAGLLGLLGLEGLSKLSKQAEGFKISKQASRRGGACLLSLVAW